MVIYELLYNLSIRIYYFAIRLAALFNSKARLWVEGRQKIFQRLERDFLPEKGNVLWFHCASLGEFEQGRPILEGLKREFPEIKIFLTFFSPSGYEIRKNYEFANWVYYLPPDFPKNAERFLSIVQPDLVVFVKYEFWYFYLKELKRNNIPTFLISAVFRKKQLFFQTGINQLHRRILSCFDHIFVQNENSRKLLLNINCQNITVAGDTRVDRVFSIAGKAKSFPLIQKFCEHKKVLVCGSTWTRDEIILKKFIKKNPSADWKYIIVPHDIREAHIQKIKKLFDDRVIHFSQIENANLRKAEILVIDNIGMLASLYRHGHLAYIGGGFGAGIHNILEPAAFGLPIIFGPKYEKFEEADYLVNHGGAFSISNKRDLESVMKIMGQPENRLKASKVVLSYLEKNKGSSKKVMSHLRTYLEKT